jgi:hypothetical protein
MKPRLALVFCVLLALAAPLQAGPILLSSSTTGQNSGSYHNRDTHGSQFYDDSLNQDQGSSSTLSISSHSARASIHDQALIEGNVTATATTSPSPTDLASLIYQATAGTGSGLDNSRTDYSQKNQLDYTATFQVTSPTAYLLTVSGTTSTSSTYSFASDLAQGIVRLEDSKGDILAAFQSRSANNGTSASGTGPITAAGILAPGTYTFFAETYLTSGSSGIGGSSESATVNSSLQLTAATPEPATLTLLGLGAVGLAGWVWRSRKSVVA